MIEVLTVPVTKNAREALEKLAEEKGKSIEELVIETLNRLVDEKANQSDPGEEAELHLTLCEKYVSEAEGLLAKGNYVQASEKLWGSAAQVVKAVAARRGLILETHNKLWDFIAKLRGELNDPEIGRLWSSANALHKNFYEAHVAPELVKDYADDVKKLIAKLEKLR